MTTGNQEDTKDIEYRVRMLEYQFGEIIKGQKRIEDKQDTIQTTVNGIRYVSVAEFAAYKEEADRRYVTNESNRPMKTLFWALIIALLTGMVSLAFFFLQKAFS